MKRQPKTCLTLILLLIGVSFVPSTQAYQSKLPLQSAERIERLFQGTPHTTIAFNNTTVEGTLANTNDIASLNSVSNSSCTLVRVHPEGKETYQATKRAALYSSPQTPANVFAQIVNVLLSSDVATPGPLSPQPLGISYEAITYTGKSPPDPYIAVGPTDLIVATNNVWRAYDKSNPGNVLYNTTLENWYAGVAPPDTNIFDPKVIFDQWHDRYIMVAIGKKEATSQSWWLVAVSQQSSAVGSWYFYAFDATLDGTTPTSNWADYPGIGVDNEVLYLTANMFTFANPPVYQYAKIRAIGLAGLYAGSVSGWTDAWNLLNGDDSKASNVQPAHRYGTAGPMYLVNNAASGNLTLWRYDTPLTAPSLVRTNVTVSPFSAPPDAEQPGTPNRIDTGDGSILQAQYRLAGIWAAQTVSIDWGGGPRAAIRLYEITTDGFLWNEITFGNPDHYLFFPSFTTDKDDNLVVMFAISGSTLYASAAYMGRKYTDPTNTIQPDMRFLKVGEGSYDLGANRWGDYSGTAIDPSNGYTVWMFHQYAKIGNVWSTWVGTTFYGRQVFLPVVMR